MGYKKQVATDVSTVVVDQMKERLGNLSPALAFEVADALDLIYADDSFDVVIEKGTLAAISADRDCELDEPNCEMLTSEKRLLLESFRVLRPAGVLIAVTDELTAFDAWTVAGLARIEQFELTESDGVPIPKRVYICFKRGPQTSPDSRLPSVAYHQEV